MVLQYGDLIRNRQSEVTKFDDDFQIGGILSQSAPTTFRDCQWTENSFRMAIHDPCTAAPWSVEWFDDNDQVKFLSKVPTRQ